MEEREMKGNISLDSLWQTIQSLSLSNRKWLANKLQEDIRESEEEREYISKEEILAGIDAGLKELKQKRSGKLETVSAEEFLEELSHGS